MEQEAYMLFYHRLRARAHPITAPRPPPGVADAPPLKRSKAKKAEPDTTQPVYTLTEVGSQTVGTPTPLPTSVQ
jgi:hypothetical protein